MPAWSYSSIKTFEQCPKKYYHLKVAKDFKDVGGEATRYGEDVHKAAEEFIKNNEPIPAKYAFMEPILSSCKALPGEKHTEVKMGLREVRLGYEACDFFDPDVWWRGIADLLVLDEERAFLVDYKTGKSARYADLKQLDLMAGAVFVKYPNIKKIKSALAFVVSGEFIPKTHYAEKRNEYLEVFEDQLDRLQMATIKGVWNPVSGPLCGWCPVTSCAHNRKR